MYMSWNEPFGPWCHQPHRETGHGKQLPAHRPGGSNLDLQSMKGHPLSHMCVIRRCDTFPVALRYPLPSQEPWPAAHRPTCLRRHNRGMQCEDLHLHTSGRPPSGKQEGRASFSSGWPRRRRGRGGLAWVGPGPLHTSVQSVSDTRVLNLKIK